MNKSAKRVPTRLCPTYESIDRSSVHTCLAHHVDQGEKEGLVREGGISCCWALRKLAGNNANKVEIATQLSVEIAKQGGIDAIIAKHGSSDAIRVEITKQGGIDAIIKALDTLPDHAWVQKVGRWALGFLANNAEIKQEIINKGGEKYLK